MIVKEKYEYKIGPDIFQGFICYDNEIEGPLSGVLVSHQYSGCSKLEERKCEFLAKAGYFAFAIDLYGKGIRGKTPEESVNLMNQLLLLLFYYQFYFYLYYKYYLLNQSPHYLHLISN